MFQFNTNNLLSLVSGIFGLIFGILFVLMTIQIRKNNFHTRVIGGISFAILTGIISGVCTVVIYPGIVSSDVFSIPAVIRIILFGSIPGLILGIISSHLIAKIIKNTDLNDSRITVSRSKDIICTLFFIILFILSNFVAIKYEVNSKETWLYRHFGNSWDRN